MIDFDQWYMVFVGLKSQIMIPPYSLLRMPPEVPGVRLCAKSSIERNFLPYPTMLGLRMVTLKIYPNHKPPEMLILSVGPVVFYSPLHC